MGNPNYDGGRKPFLIPFHPCFVCFHQDPTLGLSDIVGVVEFLTPQHVDLLAPFLVRHYEVIFQRRVTARLVQPAWNQREKSKGARRIRLFKWLNS